MLVEIVIAFISPACFTISASLALFFAFNNSKLIPLLVKIFDNTSESSTEEVPTRIG
jgi:hypothetical protein